MMLKCRSKRIQGQVLVMPASPLQGGCEGGPISPRFGPAHSLTLTTSHSDPPVLSQLVTTCEEPEEGAVWHYTTPLARSLGRLWPAHSA